MNFRNVLQIVLVVFLVLFVASIACKESTQEAGSEEQESIMEKAREAVPTPDVKHFLTRKAVAKWMKRMDVPNKLFYVYIMSRSGAMVGYYVAQYRPVSVATYLTPTKRIEEGFHRDFVLPSNALDGTYYGEGGASNQYFFFDAQTDAYIELKGLDYILQDQPLKVDVPRLVVENVNNN